jgi:enoyl-[acyl-carrier protein] reductase II
LLYPQIDDHVKIIIELGVKIVFTSAGNPKKWTSYFKNHGVTVVHVVSNLKFALKSIEAGVDAIVAEGFEAGGHNGREETTTLCLIPHITKNVSVPVIAAGGIGCGKSMLAAMSLGADAVQIGSKFIATPESSAHQNFKDYIIDAQEGDTQLTLKEVTPVRLLKNEFFENLMKAYSQGFSPAQLKELLGRGRAKKGMFLGDLLEGELEVGQVSAMMNEIKPAAQVVDDIVKEFNEAKNQLLKIQL